MNVNVNVNVKYLTLSLNSIQFNSIFYFRQESIHMYIIILYKIKYNVYLPLNTDKKINIICFNNI